MLESCIPVQVTGESSRSVAGEASQYVTEEETAAEDVESDTEHRQSSTQQQTSLASTPHSSSAQPQPMTSRGHGQKKRKAEDEVAITAIGQYFTAKGSKPASGVTASTADDDVAFGTVIGLELKKITTPWIKRAVKKQLMEAVFNGQEADEQQQVLHVVPAESVLPQTQPEASTSTIAPSDAQLLLHIQQQ